MPDKFDPYREALVVEENTIWPEGYESIDLDERQRIERALHEAPGNASQLSYVRVHSGFCRQISVTEDDIERV